ncbi:MAG: hypothetical protein HC905_10015 [Bacteroidales bacterium]|nr:hypothetical protein [Bacteroidales bacterium]
MLSNAFRYTGITPLMEEYRDSAINAFKYASLLSDKMLDNYGFDRMKGRDIMMSAAAFLYNVTGDIKYEDIMHEETLCKSGKSVIINENRNQFWATVAYLFTDQEVHYPELYSNMKSSIINEALSKEVAMMRKRPSRRSNR